jgi:hypothetical protein
MEGGKSSISAMVTVRVSEIKFHSILLRTLLASPAGRFPATAAPPVAAAAASGRGRRLFREKSAGRTSPTSAHNTMSTHQKLCYKKTCHIYQKDIKITYANKKNCTGGDLPISPRSSPGGTGIARSLEKSIPAYG